MTYEGYGPGGAAIMLDIVTDNRKRTAAEIRHVFSKHGGNLGEAGCVAWMFERKGLIAFDAEGSPGEDELFSIAVEAGAEDLQNEDGTYEVITSPETLHEVVDRFRKEGVKVERAELARIPKSYVPVSGKDAEQLLRLLEALEDHDDVQALHSNFDMDDEEMARLGA